MVKRLGYYWFALSLTGAIALAEFMVLTLVSSNWQDVRTFAHRIVAVLAIAFGLWVHSYVARYLGALWFLMSTGTIIWALVSQPLVFSFALVCILVLIGLNLSAAGVLLLSRPFADEFRHRRETEPRYKRTLRLAAHVAVIAMVVIATAMDVYRLAGS
jgi:hypothetical protein